MSKSGFVVILYEQSTRGNKSEHVEREEQSQAISGMSENGISKRIFIYSFQKSLNLPEELSDMHPEVDVRVLHFEPSFQ